LFVRRKIREKKIREKSAQAIADDAQRDLDEAIPALDAAVKCLQSLKLSHLQEVKALGDPPAGVKLVRKSCH
jgi:dynein heavy chain, axonemal